MLILALVWTSLLAAPPEEILPAREVRPGVWMLPSSSRLGSANAGWVVLDREVVVVAAGPAELAGRSLALASAGAGGKPIRRAILTQLRDADVEAARLFLSKGMTVLVAAEGAARLRAALGAGSPAASIQEVAGKIELGEGDRRLEVLDLGHAAGSGDMAVLVRGAGVLFTGEVCRNGPRAVLPGSNTELWIGRLAELEKLRPEVIVPGAGTVGGPEALVRQRRFLLELRRQVGYLVSQGRPLENIVREVRIDADRLVWMPYDEPQRPDIEHVYGELTVPRAPFGARPFPADRSRPRALALIADRFHEPGHVEEGLAPVLEAAGVDARFAVDVRALTAENLREVDLLVVLRDGMLWPNGPDQPYQIWMTPQQEQAVVEFVERGGGLLALHNSIGVYPEGGPYVKLVAGTFRGHGPPEGFRVTPVDRDHPVTRGVEAFEAADEQHTPLPDEGRVRLLLESRSAEGVVGAAGWVREQGKGRICYLASGHFRESLLHPEVQKLFRNGAAWCVEAR